MSGNLDSPPANPVARAAALAAFADYACAAFFTLLVFLRGAPILRHDWMSVPGRANFLRYVLQTLAWSPAGIGAPRSYPMDYLAEFANALFAAVFGTLVAEVAWIFAAAALCVYGARALVALAPGAPRWTTFAAATFALFNPWVYTKIVAGHVTMIAAYGALMGLAGECLRREPRPLRAALLVSVGLGQIQFAVFAFPLTVVAALVRRLWLPCLTALIVMLPTIVGILGRRHMLVAAIPYNLTWELTQSLWPLDAASLTGYFARYTADFPAVAYVAVWVVAALSAIGLIATRRRVLAGSAAAFGLAALLWASGLHGPIAPFHAAAVVHVPELEVFRELYDLLAFVAIAYIVLAALACEAFPRLVLAFAAPGIVLALVWVAFPPSAWWIGEASLPRVAVEAPPQTRIAFFPDVQPLTLGGRGSGVDPDAFPRADGVGVLDGDANVYPAGIALRRYARDGDPRPLAALAVSRIASRPWLQTDVGRLRGVLALPHRAPPAGFQAPRPVRALAAEPELAVIAPVQALAGPPPLGSGAIFFGDAAGLTGDGVPPEWASFRAPLAAPFSLEQLHADVAWVDVRQAFLSEPQLGQGIGGALTTSSAAVLPAWGPAALVRVRGSLTDATGATLSGTTQDYRWIGLPPGIRGLRCSGECVVAAFGSPPTRLTPQRPVRVDAEHFVAPLPWLAIASVTPGHDATMLRYAVAYDPNWLCLFRGRALPHVRVESALNGWVVPPGAPAGRALILEPVAAAEFSLEIFGTAWVIGLIAIARTRGRGRSPGRNRARREL